MKISLIHPSRGRPEKAKETLHYWLNHAKHPENVEHILSLDADDPTQHLYEKTDKLIINNNTCVVEATNNACKIAIGNILIYLSDDFKCPQYWDEEIIKIFSVIRAPKVLKVDDCLQPFSKDVITIPIMNKPAYRILGYFWNPLYKSMYVDQDLYHVCNNNNWLINAEHLKFPHEHYSIGKSQIDETYKRSDANWKSGQEIFLKRKDEGFI